MATPRHRVKGAYCASTVLYERVYAHLRHYANAGHSDGFMSAKDAALDLGVDQSAVHQAMKELEATGAAVSRIADDRPWKPREYAYVHQERLQ